MAKNQVHLHVVIEKIQKDKLRLISYYSGKSLGEIVRIAINGLDDKTFKKEVNK